jgi:hypothetical protein
MRDTFPESNRLPRTMKGGLFTLHLPGHQALHHSEAFVLKMMTMHGGTGARLNFVFYIEHSPVPGGNESHKSDFFTMTIVDRVWIRVSHQADLLEVTINNVNAATVLKKQIPVRTQFIDDHSCQALAIAG